MFRKVALSLLTLAGAAGAMPLCAAAEGYTTRIETRPFYGAVVTLEEGVRVFRPLPPERQVIINPNGQTPLHLGFNETRVYEYSRSHNYHYGDGGSSSAGRSYGGRAYYGHGKGHHRHHDNANRPGGVPAGPAKGAKHH